MTSLEKTKSSSAEDREQLSPGRFERMERGDDLVPGSYWMARKSTEVECPPDEKNVFFISFGSGRPRGRLINYSVDEGEVLLVDEILMDGEDVHAVQMVPHPSYGATEDRMRMLVGPFLDMFDPVDGKVVRAREIAEIQSEIALIEIEIQRAEQDAAYLNTQVMKAIEQKAKADGHNQRTDIARPDDVRFEVLAAEPPTLDTALDAMGAGGVIAQTLDMVQNVKALAEAHGKWFHGKATALSTMSSALVPYFTESAAVALARSSRAVRKATNLLESVGTLALFGANGATVQVLRDGAPAKAGTPVTLYQSRLWLDEEMSYATRYVERHVAGGIERHFVQVIAESMSLLEQMIPAERGVVLVANSRQRVYSNDPIFSASREVENKRSALLMRDGERLLWVDSEVESHAFADRLFPEEDIDGTVFRGLDGSRITTDHLRFSDKLDAMHRVAVTYRRFAVLISGMVSRGEIFADLPFDAMLTGKGNEQYMKFVRDSSGERVLDVERESIEGYLRRINENARPGMRALVNWSSAMNSTTARSCYRRGRSDDGWYRNHCPEDNYSVVLLERDGVNLVGRFTTRYSKIKRSVILTGGTAEDTPVNGFLLLDFVDPAELDSLMRVRAFRSGYSGYMDFFRAARDLAEEQIEAEFPTLELVQEALIEGKLASTEAARKIAKESIAACRSSMDVRAPDMSEVEAILKHAYRLSEAGRVDLSMLEAEAGKLGIELLRVAVPASGGAPIAYSKPKERDDRGVKQEEVDRFRVIKKAKSYGLEPSASGPLYRRSTRESTVHEWPQAAEFVIDREPLLAIAKKQAIIDNILDGRLTARRRLLCGPAGADDVRWFINQVARYRAETESRSTWNFPGKSIVCPIGLATTAQGLTWVLTVRAWEIGPLQLAYRNATDAAADALMGYMMGLSRDAVKWGRVQRMKTARANRLTDPAPTIRVAAYRTDSYSTKAVFGDEIKGDGVPLSIREFSTRKGEKVSRAEQMSSGVPDGASYRVERLESLEGVCDYLEGEWIERGGTFITDGGSWLDSKRDRIVKAWINPAIDLTNGNGMVSYFYGAGGVV